MLERLMLYVHNYFWQKSASGGRVAYSGTWSIFGGTLTVPGLLEGQRFLITGSVMNDGVYTYHSTGITNADDNGPANLSDESFTGTICPLAVPRAVLDLSWEMAEWQKANMETISSPYQSESLLGYTYTKATGTSADGSDSGDGAVFAHFKGRLAPYRRVNMT